MTGSDARPRESGDSQPRLVWASKRQRARRSQNNTYPLGLHFFAEATFKQIFEGVSGLVLIVAVDS